MCIHVDSVDCDCEGISPLCEGFNLKALILDMDVLVVKISESILLCMLRLFRCSSIYFSIICDAFWGVYSILWIFYKIFNNLNEGAWLSWVVHGPPLQWSGKDPVHLSTMKPNVNCGDFLDEICVGPLKQLCLDTHLIHCYNHCYFRMPPATKNVLKTF